MGQQAYKNQTFSLPVELSSELHAFVKQRERSRFVANAIRKELEARKSDLRKAYISANEDAGQLEATTEWIETVADNAES